jgi:hypothetical protein
MISTVCPRCERKGSVPESKVNVRLLCPICKNPFHVDAKGKSVPGDPPGHESAHHVHPKKDKVEVVEKIDHVLMDRVNVVPDLLKFLGIAAALALAALIFILPGMFFKPIPNTFEGRNQAVADAVIANDAGTLRRLCKSGTGGDAASWLGQVRPPMVAVWDPKLITSFLEPISTEASQSRMLIGFLSVQTPIRPTPKSAAHADVGFQPRGTFDVPVVWSADSGGQWWLDGSETLQLLEKSSISTKLPEAPTAPAEAAK